MTDPGTATTWYADGLRFACTRCGKCCSGEPGYVWVNRLELKRIAALLELTPDDFTRRHTRRVGRRLSLLERPGGDCEFLQRFDDGQTGCAIHAARPAQCRTWPFWSSNLSTPRAWEITARHCPGVNRGQTHPLPVIEAALRAGDQLPL